MADEIKAEVVAEVPAVLVAPEPPPRTGLGAPSTLAKTEPVQSGLDRVKASEDWALDFYAAVEADCVALAAAIPAGLESAYTEARNYVGAQLSQARHKQARLNS